LHGVVFAIFYLRPVGHELIVEIGCDGVDQLQRPGADDDRLGLGSHNGRGSQNTGAKAGHEFASADQK
jgi:hypothetical protein